MNCFLIGLQHNMLPVDSSINSLSMW